MKKLLADIKTPANECMATETTYSEARQHLARRLLEALRESLEDEVVPFRFC